VSFPFFQIKGHVRNQNDHPKVETVKEAPLEMGNGET